MTAIVHVGPAGLAELLRAETRTVHEQAETAPFISRLLAGDLPLPSYTALVVQNHGIYQALEAVGDQWSGHAVAGPFLFPELKRLPHLEADLRFLLGPNWKPLARQLLVPATARYAAHLRAACRLSPVAFVAHHYVRYLGDLSGGQIIRRALETNYPQLGQKGASFYTFDHIAKVKPFRDRYRYFLDQLQLSGDERDQLVSEAVTAFAFNLAVFTDLASACPRPPAGPA